MLVVLIIITVICVIVVNIIITNQSKKRPCDWVENGIRKKKNHVRASTIKQYWR